MMHQSTLSMEVLDPSSKTWFRDEDGTFEMDTSVTRSMGKGSKLFTIPTVNTQSKVIYSSPSVDEVTDTSDIETDVQGYNKSISNLTYNDLCVLHATKKEARTVALNGERYTYVEPNGTLENIKMYAKLTFNNDTDQEVAFIHIVSAFVVKLFDKVVNNGNTRKQSNNNQSGIDFTQPVMVLHNNQFEAMLVDANILQLLQEMNNDESVQSISLQNLELPDETMVTIKWTGTNNVTSVPVSTIKLSL